MLIYICIYINYIDVHMRCMKTNNEAIEDITDTFKLLSMPYFYAIQ